MKNFTSVKASNYINGEYAAIGHRRVPKRSNPANRLEIIGTAPLSTQADVDQAVSAAKKAYHGWSELSWVKRAEYIDAFAQLIKRDLNEIAALVTRECGKAINEGRADVVEALHMAQYIAGLGRVPNGYTVSSEIAAKDALYSSQAERRYRLHHPLELPFRDSAVGHSAVGPRGQYGRLQACRADANLRA